MASMTLPTQNEAYGFYGTFGHGADRAWAEASAAILAATGAEPEDVRAFLDSRSGRHFADSVLNGSPELSRAIAEAVAQWMGWKISSRTSREHGIPAGMPYLTGFVLSEGMAA